MSCYNLPVKIFNQNLSCTFEKKEAKCILIKALSWFDLELKSQGHRKNKKPMPREQITCHKKWAGNCTVTGGQLMCQIRGRQCRHGHQ